MICESFVPDTRYRELCNLVRTRLGLIRTRTSYKNKIHSILAKYEYTYPAYKTFSKKGIKWLQEIKLTETDRMTMDAYLGTIQTIQKQIDIFKSKMATLSKDDQRARLLMTIPEINYITTLTVISEIVDITRFVTPEKLEPRFVMLPDLFVSPLFLCDDARSAYDTTWLLYAMVEAAHATIQNDEKIKKFYKIATRRGPQKAALFYYDKLHDLIIIYRKD